MERKRYLIMKNCLAVIGGCWVLSITYRAGKMAGKRKMANYVINSCRELKNEIQDDTERQRKQFYAKA